MAALLEHEVSLATIVDETSIEVPGESWRSEPELEPPSFLHLTLVVAAASTSIPVLESGLLSSGVDAEVGVDGESITTAGAV